MMAKGRTAKAAGWITIAWIAMFGTTLDAAASAVPTPGLATLQDDKVPDKRPEVKEACAALRDHAKKRGDEDREAVEVIDKLLQEYPNSGPKDKALIVKELGKCFDQKRGELEEGVPDNKLYLAAAVALGEMGPESTKTLSTWIGHKKHKKNNELQRRLILSLGRTEDPKALKTLDGLLQHHQDMIVGAAAEALGEFDELELKKRKKVFENLMRQLIDAKTARDNDVTDVRARERYDVIAAPIVTSLQKLSGHDARAPEEWQKWWNKNKKKDWDKLD